MAFKKLNNVEEDQRVLEVRGCTIHKTCEAEQLPIGQLTISY